LYDSIHNDCISDKSVMAPYCISQAFNLITRLKMHISSKILDYENFLPLEYDYKRIFIATWVVNSEQHWKFSLCNAYFRYRGSIEYRDTWDGIVIIALISGIAQHYTQVAYRALEKRTLSQSNSILTDYKYDVLPLLPYHLDTLEDDCHWKQSTDTSSLTTQLNTHRRMQQSLPTRAR